MRRDKVMVRILSHTQNYLHKNFFQRLIANVEILSSPAHIQNAYVRASHVDVDVIVDMCV